MFGSGISSSSDVEMRSLSTSPKEKTSSLGKLDSRVVKKLDRLDCAIRIFAAISLALLILTFVFLGLAQASYISPLAALYSFGGCLGAFIVVKMIDCVQDHIARKNGLELQEDYYPVKQPPPKSKPKSKENESSSS